MKYIDCFKFLASRRTDQLVITSAGHSRNAWWQVTHDREASFYLGASMSLSSMFGVGLALGLRDRKVWAFMGDGAFCMNPGMLMVERHVNLPNLTHFVVSNRHYGATGHQPVPNFERNDYAGIARAMGVERTFNFGSIAELEDGFDAAVLGNSPAYTFVVLEVEPATEKMERCPLDGPELKFNFGRHIERITNRRVFPK
jgi:sulfopyruvate decarboxylase subunit beta